eukprot:6204012-Pleurochrysis_carterae.AAC.2
MRAASPLLVLAQLLAPAASQRVAHVPAFFWSEKADIGIGKSAQHLGEVSAVDLEHTVQTILGRHHVIASPLITGVRKAPAPEVQLIFHSNEITTEALREHGSSLSNVEKLLETSASSLTAPFTHGMYMDSDVLRHGLHIPSSEFLAYTEHNPQVFTNGATDIIVVELPAGGADLAESLKKQDEAIAIVSGLVSKLTHGNYASMLSATPVPAKGRRLAETDLPKLHITKDLYVALAVSLFLIIIFFSGFCCLFGLQTQRKFEDVLKQAQHN